MAWVFPVVGPTEWSGGSWMPTTNTHRGRTHAAVDIYAAQGSYIVAPTNGVVKRLGSEGAGGNWAQIEGDDGNTYYFAHMDVPSRLQRGQRIKGGAVVGLVGRTGSASSTKHHLHFSIKRGGVSINPLEMLRGGIIIPNISNESEIIGGRPNPRGVMGGQDWSQIVSGGYDGTGDTMPQAYYDDTPSTVQQLIDYRKANPAEETAEMPKMKAARLIQNSLRGMSNMVSRYGFQTEGASPDDTGINEIDRMEGPV
jgi:hypothetical protein